MMKSALKLMLTVGLTVSMTVLVMSRYMVYTAAPSPRITAARADARVPVEVVGDVPPVAPAVVASMVEPNEAVTQPVRARPDYDRLLTDLSRVQQSLERFDELLEGQIRQLQAADTTAPHEDKAQNER